MLVVDKPTHDKPTHWWTREHVIQLPVWPRWIAQLFCNHKTCRITGFGGGHTAGYLTTILQCTNCYKTLKTPTICQHPIGKWLTTELDSLSSIPSQWLCQDCGYTFTKNMSCPECKVTMKITGYIDMHSFRFHCPTCKVFYSREDLDKPTLIAPLW